MLDHPAAELMVECFECEGVDLVVANGDIFDCGPVSPHDLKQRKAALENGSLLEEAEDGDWLVEYLSDKGAILGTGNHEDWINDVALKTHTVGTTTVRSALGISESIEVLDHGYQLRLGSLVIEHGDIIVPRGMGGVNLANTILNRCPSQTTIVGHFHRMGAAYRTTPDRNGIPRTHAAFPIGHLSIPTAHSDYAGRLPDWQQGFAIIEVWYESSREPPRFTVRPVEIHRTKKNLPIFEYNGNIYR